MTENLDAQLAELAEQMTSAATIADDVLTRLHELKREHPDDLATILALADRAGRVWVEAASTAAALAGRVTTTDPAAARPSAAWSPNLHTRAEPGDPRDRPSDQPCPCAGCTARRDRRTPTITYGDKYGRA